MKSNTICIWCNNREKIIASHVCSVCEKDPEYIKAAASIIEGLKKKKEIKPFEEPFTIAEEEIMGHLVQAYNKFSKLDKAHPDHMNDFRNALHSMQRILMERALGRLYPNRFTTGEAYRDMKMDLGWMEDWKNKTELPKIINIEGKENAKS